MTTESRGTALVTGASRGIGRATALRLSSSHHIVAAARSGKDLETLAAEIRERGGSCDSITLDVADPAAVARALRDVRADVLVNNAGIGFLKPFLELTPEEWNTMVNVNFNALYHVTRSVLPGMVERKRGHIVIIGSIASRSAFVGGTCYGGTKHAVMGFAESLMLEVRDHGVKVSVVNPGSVATDFSPERRDPSWMLVADDVAEAVAFAVDTPPRVLMHRIEVRAAAPKKR
ncbi:MAG TPA: SDR family oxidoreductase [Gemmatimonadaceae bacterium]|nr:SDR family oxidoreductase [Gemmatimonadaceae bacterium]